MMAKEFLCTACGYVGKPKQMVKGSFVIELVLWLFFLIPGLIYSLWRLANAYRGCPVCEAQNMIPSTSPIAKKFLADLQPKDTQKPKLQPIKIAVPPPDDPYYDKENDVYVIDAKPNAK